MANRKVFHLVFSGMGQVVVATLYIKPYHPLAVFGLIDNISVDDRL